jgi:hypothetical protein
VVGDPYAGQNKYCWINPDAFGDRWTASTARSIGMLSACRGSATDANLVKNFQITESVKTTFRCEVFNLFNHPQIWSLNTGFTGDTAGAGISASNRNFGRAIGARHDRPVGAAVQFLRPTCITYRPLPHGGGALVSAGNNFVRMGCYRSGSGADPAVCQHLSGRFFRPDGHLSFSQPIRAYADPSTDISIYALRRSASDREVSSADQRHMDTGL